MSILNILEIIILWSFEWLLDFQFFSLSLCWLKIGFSQGESIMFRVLCI